MIGGIPIYSGGVDPFGGVTATSRPTLVPCANGSYGTWTTVGTASWDWDGFFICLTGDYINNQTNVDLQAQIGIYDGGDTQIVVDDWPIFNPGNAHRLYGMQATFPIPLNEGHELRVRGWSSANTRNITVCGVGHAGGMLKNYRASHVGSIGVSEPQFTTITANSTPNSYSGTPTSFGTIDGDAIGIYLSYYGEPDNSWTTANFLARISIDTAGGTSWATAATDIHISKNALEGQTPGPPIFLPMGIPDGSSIGIELASSAGSEVMDMGCLILYA